MCALMLALSTGAGSEPDYQRTVFCWSYGSRIQREGISLSFSWYSESYRETEGMVLHGRLSRFLFHQSYGVADHGVIVSQDKSTLGTGRQLYDVGSWLCRERRKNITSISLPLRKGRRRIRNRCGGCRPAWRTVYADVETHRGFIRHRSLCADDR